MGWLAEVSENKLHAKNFFEWDLPWLREKNSWDGPRYASLFRLHESVVEYATTPRIIRGESKLTLTGFRDGHPGIIVADIDSHDLNKSLEFTRLVVGGMKSKGVMDSSYVIYFSGGKGFHVAAMAESFGPDLLLAKPTVSLRAHEAAARVALMAMAGEFWANPVLDRTTLQTIRLFRLPNSRHDETKYYKIPLTANELFHMSIDDIKGVAIKPRVGDIPATPPMMLDPVWESLVKPLLEAHNAIADQADSGSRILRQHARSTRTPSQAAPSMGQIEENDLPPYSEEGLETTRDMVKQNFQRSHRLRDSWEFNGDKQSSMDFRVVEELYEKSDWDRENLCKALWARRQSKAHRVGHGRLYVERTVATAMSRIDEKRAIRAAASPQTLIAKEQSSLPIWLMQHPAWLKIGTKAQAVYSIHLGTAMVKTGYKPLPGTKSGRYFLACSSIRSEQIAGAKASQTIRESHQKLLAAKLIRKQPKRDKESKGFRKADEWIVRVPKTEEIDFLMELGISKAMKIRRANAKKREDQKKKKAKQALGKMDIDTINSIDGKDLTEASVLHTCPLLGCMQHAS